MIAICRIVESQVSWREFTIDLVFPFLCVLLEHHQGYSQQQLAQIRDMEHTSSKRSQEIESIVKSINDLAELFKELSVLVVEQVPVRAIPASCCL
jgi:hypothetical protein